MTPDHNIDTEVSGNIFSRNVVNRMTNSVTSQKAREPSHPRCFRLYDEVKCVKCVKCVKSANWQSVSVVSETER